ncbi:MAG: P-loop NTPase fold protein [bacterium]
MKQLQNLDPNLEKKINDTLHSESKLVKKILNLIINDIKPPFTISIDGDWGTGKTTIMRLLKNSLEQKKLNYPTFWFNPWEYKESNDVVLAFLQKLAQKYTKVTGQKTEKIGKFFKLLFLAGIDVSARLISNGNLSASIIKENEKILKEDLKEWQNYHDIIKEIKNEFVGLCSSISEKYGNKSLIIFLDDFDRCLPDDTIKLLEAIKNLFCTVDDEYNKPSVIFICVINTQIAQNFIKKHYHLEDEKSNYSLNYFI